MNTNDMTSNWKKKSSDPQLESSEVIASSSGESAGKVSVHQFDAAGSATKESAPNMKTPFGTRLKNFVRSRRGKRILGIIGIITLIFVIIGGALGFVAYRSYVQAREMEAELRQAMNEGQAAYASFKAQDLVMVRTHIQNAKTHIEAGQEDLQGLKWTGSLPFVGKYYHDGEAGFRAALAGSDAALEVVAAVEPHADVLGFSGEGTFSGGTTEDRIGLMLETLAQITPQLDGISAKVEEMNTAIAEIDPNDYPEELRGYPLRQYVQMLHDAGETAKVALTDARPVIEQLPAMAGAEGEPKKYLVIFQNDNELRPTGGFMTAYAVIKVENGKIFPEKSDDIYVLDQKFRQRPPIPEQLGRYLTSESRWNLRDMNIDPNFSNSMDTFYSYYQNIPGEHQDIDGIIAIDTNVLTRIVEVLGPVDVPGYGTFSAETDRRCDCAQIIYVLSEIIDRPTPYIRENRKGILAPMMQSIIQKTYATSKDKWPLLAELAWQGIEGRHVQFHFFDEKMQAAAETINAAGLVPVLPEEGDYLTVIDANLGGAKSNLFIETSGVIDVESMADGKVTKTVELTYRNTHPASNCDLEAGQLCLNGTLNDWTRWYVPKGVEINQVMGLDEGHSVDSSNENYDVIEGTFKVEPMGQTRVRITYTVPYDESEYMLTMQKQGGTDVIPFELTTPQGQVEFDLDKDKTVSVQ